MSEIISLHSAMSVIGRSTPVMEWLSNPELHEKRFWNRQEYLTPHEDKIDEYLKSAQKSKEYINNRFYSMQMYIDYLVSFRIEQRVFEEENKEKLKRIHFLPTGRIHHWKSKFFSFTTTFQILNQKPLTYEEFRGWIIAEYPKLPL